MPRQIFDVRCLHLAPATNTFCGEKTGFGCRETCRETIMQAVPLWQDTTYAYP